MSDASYHGPMPGDVVLLARFGLRSWINRRLQGLIGPQYSHVMIVVASDRVLHSTPKGGVHASNLWAEIRSSDIKRLRIIRNINIELKLKMPSDRFEHELREHAKQLQGYKYNFVFRFCNLIGGGCGQRFFCSELVAELLRRVGGDQGIGRSSWNVFPRQFKLLEKNLAWYDVTQEYQKMGSYVAIDLVASRGKK